MIKRWPKGTLPLLKTVRGEILSLDFDKQRAFPFISVCKFETPLWAAKAASGTGRGARTTCGRGWRKGGDAPLHPARQQDHIKGTSGTPYGLFPGAGRAGNRHDPVTEENRNSPYRRVKGGCWEIGLDSLVTCRRHPLAARRLSPQTGLHTPRAGDGQ